MVFLKTRKIWVRGIREGGHVCDTWKNPTMDTPSIGWVWKVPNHIGLRNGLMVFILDEV